jgi:hypothetical protein
MSITIKGKALITEANFAWIAVVDQLALLRNSFSTYTSCEETSIALVSLSIGWLDGHELLVCDSGKRTIMETRILSLYRRGALVPLGAVSAEVVIAFPAVPKFI